MRVGGSEYWDVFYMKGCDGSPVFCRIYPDHNDDGGVSAACCHDSHPRGSVTDAPVLQLQARRLLNMCLCVSTADEQRDSS